MRLLTPCLAGAFFAACNCGPPTTPQPDGGGPNGIYRLSATTVSDGCMPRACEWDAGFVGVTTTAGVTNLPVRYCFGGTQPFLMATQYLRLPADYVIRDGCAAGIGRHTLEVEAQGPPLVVRSIFTFDAGACVDAGTTAAMWPTTPCSSDQRLTYDLVQDCQPPCTLMGAPAITCKCP